MPLYNDCMIIIGSRQSANTRRLYQISRSLNKNTYWANCAGDIKKVWFKNARTVGISAGASTPDTTIREIVSYVKKLPLRAS